MSKPKANTLNICCDVFVCNCQFVMTFSACITVVVNRLTHVVFHKVSFGLKEQTHSISWPNEPQ